ncbi:MAG TPA: aspartate kinase [Candidatus Hydrogenedentes bacterium]|nr:aspartate kinase [Candidatus Hydrogenedentota bacterium]HQH51829.1 aspartate kinase [Candidatus Hydrogenedentota bacterium]HQM49607.1 aspartate kinase [Candidatus Hydrogenedentota bacterium]
MGFITCKFGGSSLADAACVRKAEAIIRSDPQRRYIVPSAPGKRTEEDKKITDLLYAWHSLAKQGLDVSQPKGIIAERFGELARELGIPFDVGAHMERIAAEGEQHAEPDYMASRGEYLNGLLMAELLGATFIDPAECVFFDDEGGLDKKTYSALAKRMAGDGLFVVPGFYGVMPDGRVRTFSRGGSDVTGAIVARATHSVLYENWTDVSGFRMADPRVVPHARRIQEVTYKELRELSYMGAKVLHEEAIFPVRETGIPVNIRNTHKPEVPGTMIVSKRESTEPVCGIAARKGFSMITIEKALMNRELGFGRRLLMILEEFGISFEHMPSSIDTVSVIVRDDLLGSHGPAVIKKIERRCDPDRVELSPGLALIATVGQGMAGHIGIAAKLMGALAEARVNIRVIDQGSSENNIIVGVEDKDMETAVRAIYGVFTHSEG